MIMTISIILDTGLRHSMANTTVPTRNNNSNLNPLLPLPTLRIPMLHGVDTKPMLKCTMQ